jgi:hypothetical protein
MTPLSLRLIILFLSFNSPLFLPSHLPRQSSDLGHQRLSEGEGAPAMDLSHTACINSADQQEPRASSSKGAMPSHIMSPFSAARNSRSVRHLHLAVLGRARVGLRVLSGAPLTRLTSGGAFRDCHHLERSQPRRRGSVSRDPVHGSGPRFVPRRVHCWLWRVEVSLGSVQISQLCLRDRARATRPSERLSVRRPSRRSEACVSNEQFPPSLGSVFTEDLAEQ